MVKRLSWKSYLFLFLPLRDAPRSNCLHRSYLPYFFSFLFHLRFFLFSFFSIKREENDKSCVFPKGGKEIIILDDFPFRNLFDSRHVGIFLFLFFFFSFSFFFFVKWEGKDAQIQRFIKNRNGDYNLEGFSCSRWFICYASGRIIMLMAFQSGSALLQRKFNANKKITCSLRWSLI